MKLTCKEATRLMLQKEDNGLSFNQRLKLALHTYYCNLCRRFAKHSSILSKAGAAEVTPTVTLSEEEKQKLRELLKK